MPTIAISTVPGPILLAKVLLIAPPAVNLLFRIIRLPPRTNRESQSQTENGLNRLPFFKSGPARKAWIEFAFANRRTRSITLAIKTTKAHTKLSQTLLDKIVQTRVTGNYDVEILAFP